jgi:hypothetical protein
MSHHPALFDGLFATGYTLEQAQEELLSLEGLYIDQVGCRQAVLRDEYGRTVAFYRVYQFGSFTLQGGDQLGTHEVIL